MRAKDLKGWLAAARRDETEREKRIKDGGDREGDMAQTDVEGHWGRGVEIMQTAFWEGELAEDSTCQAVVLIPKGKGGLPGHQPSGGDVEGRGGGF